MSMALPLSRDNLVIAGDNAYRHVRRGKRNAGFVLSIAGITLWAVGRALDRIGSSVVQKLILKLERDVIFFRGLKSAVDDFDAKVVLDPDLKITKKLVELEENLADLHRMANKVRRDRHLVRTSAGFRQVGYLTNALHKAVEEVRLALVDHDACASSTDVNSAFDNLFASMRGAERKLAQGSDLHGLATESARRYGERPKNAAQWARSLASDIKDADD